MEEPYRAIFRQQSKSAVRMIELEYDPNCELNIRVIGRAEQSLVRRIDIEFRHDCEPHKECMNLIKVTV